MTERVVTSWGRLRASPHDVFAPRSAKEIADKLVGTRTPWLAYGNGRSYGDVCMNAGHGLIDTRQLDRFVAADWTTGVVRVGAGMTIDSLLRQAVPNGWFVRVSPGTKYVTVGGAVANDVHGKNHGAVGTFGRAIRRVGMVRSDRGELEISPSEHPELFTATIGGLGLTGIMTWVELELERIQSTLVETETLRMNSIDDYIRAAASAHDWPFSVAWVDCLAQGASIGRGLFTRARWSAQGALTLHRERPRLSVPFDLPEFTLNRHSIAAFNRFYRLRPNATGPHKVHYDSFFYPLDAINAWNRFYGRRGFFQHQSVVPSPRAPDTISAMLELTAKRRQGSFLIVIKEFGDLPSPGVLSFPRPGTTFALDFPNRGLESAEIVDRLNDLAVAAGGRIYPGKDARMTGEHFKAGYPEWSRVEKLRDPALLSDFWRRVTGVSA
jgi:FAD/FMN-containing dehydrogenase